MTRLLVLLLLFALPLPARAGFDPVLLEQIGSNYRSSQPGLESYAVTVSTPKVGEMITQMTSSLPAEVPRPEVPVLTKYWSRAVMASVVLAEGKNLQPTMQEMVERFSREFAVDLPLSLFPPSRAIDRADWLRQGTVEVTETRLDGHRRLGVRLRFAGPVNLDGAFFGRSLPVPQNNLTELSFDLDPDLRLLYQVDFVSAANQHISMEIRHQEFSGKMLPTEVRVTSPDGRIDDHLQTEMGRVQSFWLPVRQVRSTVRPERKETVTVTFSGYRLNLPLPPAVLQRLGGY
ncbi:hypothetical protein JCM30471_31740 [Desulfuromonas carbonis]|uniref:hypothetical protein n=1 Tax=Desulfuromonas sp. DDH964 TaxID=1823759 RepID=UPI00078D7543|nr:hypothetical protein [Desulfuromonas sp. DDH964]AMV71337.1 hypothetical protein DBW_0955 [Desulfuromonas sp. DDH964]